MKIAIIGAGIIGRTLGGKLAAAGHDVTLCVRRPDAALAESPDLSLPVTEVTPALDGAQVVLLAIPGTSVDAFLAEHGGELGDAVVIDAANKIGSTLGDRAAQFITESAGRPEPFLLYLPLTSPHTPLAVTPRCNRAATGAARAAPPPPHRAA